MIGFLPARPRRGANGLVGTACQSSMSPIPPAGGLPADALSGFRATSASVVVNNPATEATFCKATRTTFERSMMADAAPLTRKSWPPIHIPAPEHVPNSTRSPVFTSSLVAAFCSPSRP